VIYNDNIRRQRGGSSSKRTKHLKEAMKLVKEHFKPMPADKLATDIVEDMTSVMTNMTYWAGDRTRNMMSKSFTDVVKFITDIKEGNDANLALARLETVFPADWQQNVDSMRIANSVRQAFDNKQGVIVRVERDNSLTMVDLNTLQVTPCKSTYDLPTNYQEKITMLKLVDKNQPIEYVGVKFLRDFRTNGIESEHHCFFLIEGETYTTC
jgi:hypothetical protein